jgi:hypothetical protein
VIPLHDRTSRRFHSDAFGLQIESDFVLPGAGPEPGPARPYRLQLRRTKPAALPGVTDEPRYLCNLQSYAGSAYAMLEGETGDVLFIYGRQAVFHLSSDRAMLRCAVPTSDAREWERVLMDTVLWTIALLRGCELLHASAVATAHGVVAFIATTGSGKSSLASEFLRRGARLFSDDVVALGDPAGEIVAYPGPPVMNLPVRVNPETVGGHEVLHDFGAERWLHLTDRRPPAQGLAAAVLLHRSAGAATGCERAQATSLTLLPHALSLPHLGERARRRFELFGAVAATVPVWMLQADLAVSTAELADLIETRIGRA